jgi:DNA-binding MarR family transcriptional regulator
MTETARDSGLTTALLALAHHVLHLFAEVGRGNKLSQQQVEMICAIVVRGRVGMTELGRLMHLERSNISNLVDRAELRGLVIRTRDADDRRITWVELTAEGNTVALRVHAEVSARLNRLINHLPSDDQRHLTAVVNHLLAAEEALPTPFAGGQAAHDESSAA